jgi:transcriptional regulator with XRE-family HTH domain
VAVSALAALIEKAQDDFLAQTGVELTQGDIARRSGLSRQRISQMMTERPKTLPPHETLEMLAKGLRVSYDLVLQRALEATGYDVPDRFPEPVLGRRGVGKLSALPQAARRGKAAKTLGQDEQQV